MKRDHDAFDLWVQQIRSEATAAARAYDEAMGVSRQAVVVEQPLRPLHMSPLLPTFDPTWKDRCLSCASVLKTTGAAGEQQLACDQVMGAFNKRRACIDARDPRAPCGPDAKLWRQA